MPTQRPASIPLLPDPCPPADSVPPRVTLLPEGWSDVHAEFYAATLDESDYAQRVAPVLGGSFGDVLDVGAGSGVLTRRCLAPGASWRAVEPNAAMRARLENLRAPLERVGIALLIDPRPWQALDATLRADTVLAANLGATHHDASRFAEAMAPRFARTMTWVVAAQSGPSTFCLAGFLPSELHGADVRPAHLATLDALSPTFRPDTVAFVDWTCRKTFQSLAHAQAHFVERLAIDGASPRGSAVKAFVAARADVRTEGVTVACAKRSAVLRWIGPLH